MRIDGAWHPADSTFTYDPASDTLTFDVYWNPEKDLALSFKLSGEDLDRFMKRVVKVRMNGRETTGEATKGTAPQAG